MIKYILFIISINAFADSVTEQRAFEAMLKARGWRCNERACFAPTHPYFKKLK